MNKSVFIILAILVVAFVASAQLQQPVEVNQPHPPQLLPSNSPLAAPLEAEEVCSVLTTKPTPETKKYIFKSCIVAQLAAYLDLGEGKYIELKNAEVHTKGSQCENATSNQDPILTIDFTCGNISFAIGHSNDSKTFVKGISGTYLLKDKNATVFNYSTPSFSTTQPGHYYKCNTEQTITVATGINLMLSNFALEAYRDAAGTDFYQIPEECPLDSQPVSDLVRIGVGVCLVALVAIVLIAYFIGRRRWSERSSYESV